MMKLAKIFLVSALFARLGGAQTVSALSIAQDAFQLNPASSLVTRPLLVDSTDFMTVVVSSPSKTLSVTLVTPTGTRFTAGDPPNASFRAGIYPDPTEPTTSGANYMINATNPGPGLWSLEVSLSPAPVAPVDVLVWTSFNNQTRVAMLGGGEAYPLGTNVRIGLAAFDGLAKIGSLTIQAHVFRPGDPTFPLTVITFTDNGAGADPIAGDRIYSAFVVPPTAGDYQVQAKISGTSSTGAFSRTAAVEFPVVVRGATLDGTFIDRGIDANTPADALLNQIAVAPRVTLPATATYNITVMLRASNNKTLSRSFEGELSAGTVSPEVLFDTADIRDHLSVDGPYQVAEVRVDRVGTAVVLADLRYNLGSTLTYTLSSFQTPPVLVAGVTASTGIDTNSNGLFDRFIVGMEVKLRTAAEYEYSASLVDRNNREIEFHSVEAKVLDAGPQTLNLVFDGGKIGQNGVDGPFELRNLIVTDHGENSVIANRVGRTEAFGANQFEPVETGVRGDGNGDGRLTVGDIFFLLSHLFAGGTSPSSAVRGDANGDGHTTVADVFFLIHHLFTGGIAPPM